MSGRSSALWGVVLAVATWLPGPVVVAGVDSESIRGAMAAVIAAARAMVEHGDRGDLAGMTDEAQRVVEAGERALATLPQPGNRHARDAAEHLREAMASARQVIASAARGEPDDAVKHARRALRQVRRGVGHAEAL